MLAKWHQQTSGETRKGLERQGHERFAMLMLDNVRKVHVRLGKMRQIRVNYQITKG